MTNPFPIEAVASVEHIPGSKLAKKIICKICSEVVYSLSDNPTQAELDREAKGLAAHMEFRHGFAVETVRCSDPRCLGGHRE